MQIQRSAYDLKEGFTTGTAAAAAACAAVLKRVPAFITVQLPNRMIEIPVSRVNGKIGVIKYSGDDPDITANIFIYCDVALTPDNGDILIDGGAGIGRVTRRGLQVPVGQAAINPVPRQIIEKNLRRFLPKGCGAKVIVHAPEGERLAEKTFNKRLGIVGGISILGTTGIVRPMSTQAIIETIYCEIDVLEAEGQSFIWLVPGAIGERALHRLLNDAVSVQFSNYAGEALSYLRKKGYSSAGIAGHPGKLAKIAAGYYNTHSAVSPQANSYIAELFDREMDFNTVEEVCKPENSAQFNLLAQKLSQKICADMGFDAVKVLLFSMEGHCVGRYE